jgi:hypothetical protein
VQTEQPIQLSQYPGLFKYLVYDGYRPSNLAHTRDYLSYIQDEEEDSLTKGDARNHLVEYLETELTTKFPPEINDKNILKFD